MSRIVILISGRGSNMQAIVDARIAAAEVAAVISNRADAAGLAFARERGIETRVVDHRSFATRAAFDVALADEIDAFAPDLVVLAGFMRVLTDAFVLHYRNRLLNVHPSLLPAFSGLDTHRRALEAGVRVHGATVHLVTPQLDAGPIVAQAVVPVLPGSRRSGCSSPKNCSLPAGSWVVSCTVLKTLPSLRTITRQVPPSST